MAQVVDSAQWTGISTDPFAALSAEERQGVVQYEATGRKFARQFAVCGGMALFGVLMVVLSATVKILPKKGFEWLFEALGIEHNTAVFLFGLFLVAGAVILFFESYKRLRRANLSAPLIISGSYLSVGAPALKILLREVTSVRPQRAGGLSEIANQPPFPKLGLGASNEFQFLEVLFGKSAPLILDLAALNEKPDRIATVLQYRVLKARGELDA